MLKICTTVVATLAVAGIACAEDAVQWTEAEGGNGHWYQAVRQVDPLFWLQAKQIAESQGAHLATLSTGPENDWVKYQLANDEALWESDVNNCLCLGPYIGGYRDAGGPWTWIDGSEWNFTDWHPNTPHMDENYPAAIRFWDLTGNFNGYAWIDHDLSVQPSSSYVMEYSADCNGDGIVDYGQILDGSLADDDGNGIPDICESMNESAIQWKIEDGGNGHWYLGLTCNSYTSIEAENEAVSLGGHLASLPNASESNWVRDNIANNEDLWDGDYKGPWIGAYSLVIDEWEWTDGAAWGYTDWHTGNPNNGVPADVSWWDRTGTFSWGDDVRGEARRDGYIIEWSADCNGDGIVDYGQIQDGSLEDQDEDGIPDCCESGECLPLDCNDNGIPDTGDLVNGTSQDCNGNDIPDECDIADGVSVDCNGNLIPDECESLADCDSDGTPDACEILDGAIDANPADGIPDECQGLGRGACCHNGGCVLSTFDDCFAANGSFAGNGISCADANCPAPCPGDIDGDGQIGIVELLIVIDRWGFCP